MTNKQLETLTWVFIYSGLLMLCLGWFMRRGGDEMLGLALVIGGVADAALGLVLLWWRSRRPD